MPSTRQRILVIDEVPNERELLALALRREGYEVVAEDGPHGMAEVGRAMPDLIVLDLSMAEAAALDLCRGVRSETKGPRPRIVMLGTRGEEIDCAVGLELGAEDCLMEPFTVDELVARIQARWPKPRAL
jgi:DNA-binding response OmpR family regulator